MVASHTIIYFGVEAHMSNQEQKTPQGLKEQRARRQRVNRIKTGILLFVVIWMVVCMSLNIFLLVRMDSLEDQVSILTDKMIQGTQIPAEDKKTPPSGTDGDFFPINKEETTGQDSDETSSASDEETNDQAGGENPGRKDVRACVAVEDNLREEGEPMNVYLTFDDGPSENTSDILEILRKHNVKATFFVTGKEGEEAGAWYRAIVADGHTLGMHSYSHRYSTIYESVDAFKSDFTKLHDYLMDVTGVDSKFYRFPGGSSNQVSNTDVGEFIDFLGEEGMTYYDWNVVCGDATSQIYTADELVENVMTDVVKYRNSVVLMHDAAEKDTTVEALEILLRKLEELGAQILPITEDAPVIHHSIS